MTRLTECGEVRLDASGWTRTCALTEGHAGPHIDATGQDWEPPAVTLERLRDRWGATHRIAWTGRLWMATAHHADVPWRTEVEPTPAQLEAKLKARRAYPAPLPRRGI